MGAALSGKSLSTWAVSGPALALAGSLLNSDVSPIARSIGERQKALHAVLAGAGLAVAGGTPLFALVADARAGDIYTELCRHHILVRRFDYAPDWLRFGLTPDVSDADSAGYFQMRVSIWNIPPWTNYMNEPEKQLHWFLSQALALKEKRIADGVANFGQARDAASLGEWIADVERPAFEYRGRYATHFDEAQQLISGQRSSL